MVVVPADVVTRRTATDNPLTCLFKRGGYHSSNDDIDGIDDNDDGNDNLDGNDDGNDNLDDEPDATAPAVLDDVVLRLALSGLLNSGA